MRLLHCWRAFFLCMSLRHRCFGLAWKRISGGSYTDGGLGMLADRDGRWSGGVAPSATRPHGGVRSAPLTPLIARVATSLECEAAGSWWHGRGSQHVAGLAPCRRFDQQPQAPAVQALAGIDQVEH